MSAVRRFRDAIRSYVPPWLSDRPTSGKTVGFRVVWTVASVFDAFMDHLVQGLKASWPGLGTETALPYIGRSRGILRGPGETVDQYVARLIEWLDTWRGAGGAEAIARQIKSYLVGHPNVGITSVKVITRSGYWVILDSAGNVTRTTAAWDWDGTSHPERAGYWSEIWIVVYAPTLWAHSPVFGTRTVGSLGIGHEVNRADYEALRGLINTWKSAHTKVRAVIWTTSSTLFDPTTPASLPDGSWGAWGTTGSSRVASGRNLASCRYWEFD